MIIWPDIMIHQLNEGHYSIEYGKMDIHSAGHVLLSCGWLYDELRFCLPWSLTICLHKDL